MPWTADCPVFFCASHVAVEEGADGARPAARQRVGWKSGHRHSILRHMDTHVYRDNFLRPDASGLHGSDDRLDDSR